MNISSFVLRWSAWMHSALLSFNKFLTSWNWIQFEPLGNIIPSYPRARRMQFSSSSYRTTTATMTLWMIWKKTEIIARRAFILVGNIGVASGEHRRHVERLLQRRASLHRPLKTINSTKVQSYRTLQLLRLLLASTWWRASEQRPFTAKNRQNNSTARGKKRACECQRQRASDLCNFRTFVSAGSWAHGVGSRDPLCQVRSSKSSPDSSVFEKKGFFQKPGQVQSSIDWYIKLNGYPHFPCGLILHHSFRYFVVSIWNAVPRHRSLTAPRA